MPLLAPGELADGYPAGTVLDEWPVDLGELRLGRVDEYGGQWIITEFTSRGSAPASVEVTQRVSADGAWVGGRWYAAKPYTIDLAYTGQSAADRFDAEQRLTAAASVTDTLMVMHDEQPRTATVLLNGEVTIDTVNAYAFTAQVPLIAPDPFRYSLTPYTGEATAAVQSGGLSWPASWPASWSGVVQASTLIVNNGGNTTSHPVFRVYGGPLDSFVLSHHASGQSMSVDLGADGFTLKAGEWIEIDTLRQTIRLLGVTDMRRTLRGDFLGLPPGVSEVSFAPILGGDSTAGRVTMTGYSTWL